MELVGEAAAEVLLKLRAGRSNADGKKKRGWKYGISSFALIRWLPDAYLQFLVPYPRVLCDCGFGHESGVDWLDMRCRSCTDILQIVITPPSFATDGIIWHVTLSCGCGLIHEKIVIARCFPNHRVSCICCKGDTILIGAGGKHLASDIKIQKLLCLIGGGELPDETTLVCSRVQTALWSSFPPANWQI